MESDCLNNSWNSLMVLSTIAPQRSGLITQKHPFLSFFVTGYIVVEFMQFIDRFYELLENTKKNKDKE